MSGSGSADPHETLICRDVALQWGPGPGQKVPPWAGGDCVAQY